LASGSRRGRAVEVVRTLEAARAWKVQVESAQPHGGGLDPRAGKRTFENYATDWLAHRPLADQTQELHQHQLDRHVLPTFGETALARITPSAVRRWNAALAARGGLVAAKCYRLLRSILASAVEDGLIPANPCTIRGAGVEESAERPFVESTAVLELVGAAHPRVRGMILVAPFGGLRVGELRALAVRDFNEVTGMVTVGESIDPKLRRKAPKSAAGRRPVVLPGPVVQALAVHVAAPARATHRARSSRARPAG
jgi:integrase